MRSSLWPRVGWLQTTKRAKVSWVSSIWKWVWETSQLRAFQFGRLPVSTAICSNEWQATIVMHLNIHWWGESSNDLKFKRCFFELRLAKLTPTPLAGFLAVGVCCVRFWPIAQAPDVPNDVLCTPLVCPFRIIFSCPWNTTIYDSWAVSNPSGPTHVALNTCFRAANLTPDFRLVPVEMAPDDAIGKKHWWPHQLEYRKTLILFM